MKTAKRMPTTRTLQEVLIAVHFAEAVPLSILDYASWIEMFGGVHPVVQQLSPLPPTSMQPGLGMLPAIPAFSAELPRIRVDSSDSQYFNILQSDRVGFGWRRKTHVGELDEYPGYDFLKDYWKDKINNFGNWLNARLNISLSPRYIELDYNNAIPFSPDSRLSERFRFVDVKGRRLRGFQVTWTEPVGPQDEGYVQAQCAFAISPPATQVLGLNYFSLIPVGVRVGEDATATMLAAADALHSQILDMHNAAIISGD
jgi:hypothetical protein